MLEQVDYCPLLFTRVAEIKAYKHLPTPTKSAMFPVLRWRPWPNARSLDKTWERVGDAIGGGRFCLTLDASRRDTSSNKPVDRSFSQLFSPERAFEAYYSLARELPFCTPVIRGAGADIPELARQIDHLSRIDRGAAWHIEHPTTPSEELMRKVIANTDNLVIILDAGWGRDLLLREAWALRLARRAGDIDPDCEIVVAGSSFPQSFSHIASRGETAAEERPLFSNLVRSANAASLTYGDWGSTRPPSPPTPMRNIPRIDVPYVNQWVSFRQTGAEDYADLAQRALQDNLWPGDLRIWGTYAIEATAQRTPGSIAGPASAAAARINIHLYRQAQFGAVADLSEGDEPYVD